MRMPSSARVPTFVALSLCVSILLILPQHVSAVQTALAKPPNNLGLVSYWKFDEGTGSVATDFSGNGDTGTLITTASNLPNWVGGKFGKALSFDAGTNYVDIGNRSNLKGDDCTISLWVKTPAAADGSQSPYIASINSGSTDYWNVELGVNGGIGGLTNPLIAISYVVNGGPNYGVGYTTTNRTELFDNAWHHVVITSDTSTHIYLDGVSKTVTTGAGSDVGHCASQAAINDFRIGDGQFTFFNGLIDEVRVYSRALSANEVSALYRTGSTKFTSSSVEIQKGSSLSNGLLGHWTFDGPDVTTFVADRSGNGNKGGFIGSSTSSAKTIGKLGQALNLNSTSYVGVTLTSGLPLYSSNTTYSFAAWVKAPAVIGKTVYSDFNSAGSAAFVVSQNSSVADGTIEIDIFNNSGSTIGGGISTGVGFDNTWHHIVWTDNNGTVALYIDGRLDSGTFSDARVGVTMNTTRVGAYTDGAGANFNGKIDDVRVYNRALTAAEAKQLYNLGIAKIKSN